MGRFENFRIGRACPLLVVKRLKPLTALSGTVHRLASSMSDHTPVLLNVFEDWNEESVVPLISFDSIHIRFERKRPICRSLFWLLLVCAFKFSRVTVISRLMHFRIAHKLLRKKLLFLGQLPSLISN